jgi:hypothetical protein
LLLLILRATHTLREQATLPNPELIRVELILVRLFPH